MPATVRSPTRITQRLRLVLVQMVRHRSILVMFDPMVEFNRCVAQRGLTSTELRPKYARRRFSFTLWLMVFDDMRGWLVRNN
jgi:hypothetical protein